MKLRALALVLLAASCGDDPVDGPATLDVRVEYRPQALAGCPDAGNPCYPMCAHHNAPAGRQVIVTLWDQTTTRLAEADGGRYVGTLFAVPTERPLRLYGRDIAMCCVDACSYPPVLHDVFLNGTKLTRVVTDGLPAGATGALEFTLRRDGTVAN